MPLAWVKPDATAAQIDADLYACRDAAWREARMRTSWFYRPVLPYAVEDVQGRRVLVWPQGMFHDPFGDQFMEESRLTHFCMHAKGYELVPVEKEAAKK